MNKILFRAQKIARDNYLRTHAFFIEQMYNVINRDNN